MLLNFIYRFTGLTFVCLVCFIRVGTAQSPSAPDAGALSYPADAGSTVKTYINPVLGGDHPDPTLLKVGDDFYMCGSSFHFVPNLPILHSRDLLHWEITARVIPADWPELKSGSPGAGIWQGAISYFYGTYHIYFSNGAGGGQYLSVANKPSGPWSVPRKVLTTPETGASGYDNSIFVDDDGTPYMIIKAGQTTNRIQQIDRSGDLTGKLINLDWINRGLKYSWAEGPVMCKRDGWYYYFMAGDVTGGQFILRSKSLTADSAQWQNLGSIFAFSRDPDNRFRSVNHMSSPFQLKDGSWWCLAQSYDAPKNDDWSGQGRQDLLLRVQWTSDGRPFVPYPSDQPLISPGLSNTGLAWRLPRSDHFNKEDISAYWHFLSKKAAMQYSLTARRGWLHLDPGAGRTHILQKEGGHSYALVTRVDLNAAAAGEQAGLYLTSGDESVSARLYSGFEDGKKKFIVTLGKQRFDADNLLGNTVWLKLERNEHRLSGYYSGDGTNWTRVGQAVDAVELDKAQPRFNAWVGTSAGMYAERKPADFDLFLYKDGFSELPVAGANNYFGFALSHDGALLKNSPGGWLMLGGVDFRTAVGKKRSVSIAAAATRNATIEIWMDDLGAAGRKIASIPVRSTGNLSKWITFSSRIPAVSGQHDVYVRVRGQKDAVTVKWIRFK